MERPRVQSAVVALMGMLLCSMGTAEAGVTAAQKCEAAKLGTAGKYDFCRLKTEAKAIKTGGSPDFTKCDDAYGAKWSQTETKAGGSCPSNGDQGAMQAFIIEHADAVKAELNGNPLLEGVVSCNADLATCNATLATCNSKIGVLKTGQTTAFGAGSDGDLQKGTSRSYTDNGDGTITDNTTGLMWEKKSYDGAIHDYANTYTWSGPSYGTTNVMDGTITSVFLAILNGGGGFAGHTDWRIPNRFELESILNFENAQPAADSVFNTNCMAGCNLTMCSCTHPVFDHPYWTSTTIVPPIPPPPADVFVVHFSGGLVDTADKSASYCVRAVRGGL
jgi:hypothetical protein